MSVQLSPDGGSSRALEKVTAAHKREELRAGVRDCRNRGLYQAAKWASEQLAGFFTVLKLKSARDPQIVEIIEFVLRPSPSRSH